MKAFINCEVSKKELITELEYHRRLDHLIQGYYWKKEKGCDTGCTLHKFAPGKENDHSLFPKLFGISERFAHLCDKLFEGLPLKEAKEFPLERTKSISIGCDTNLVVDKFLLWLLSEKDSPISNYKEEKHIKDVASLYRRKVSGEEVTKKEWKTASDSAYAAAKTAYAAAKTAYAADAAAYAADYAVAASDYAADAYAADSAAYAADYASYAAADYAADSAYAAAYVADADAAAADSADAATYAAYKRMANKLIEILKKIRV